MNPERWLGLLLCVGLFLTGLDRCVADELTAFVTKVEAAPAWASLNEDKLKIHAADIEKLGNEFQNFSLEDTREIVKRLEDRAYKNKALGEPEDSLSRIYVLLRFYFAVPEYEQSKKVRPFGGWLGIKEKDDQYNILYPLILDRDGDLRLRGVFQGYMGPSYSAVRELEHFNREYGPRKRHIVDE
jgi:hypothetical protein